MLKKPTVHLLAASFLALLGLQCIEQPLDPVLPTTDLQLSIPLVNRVKLFEEFVKDTLLKRETIGDTTGYFYSAFESIEPISIDTVKAEPQPSSQEVELGTFQIESPGSMSAFFTYKEITGSDPPPVPAPIPPATFTLPRYDLLPIASFEYVDYATGSIVLVVRNNLPVSISFLDPIVLKNNRIGAPVDTAEVARFSLVGQQLQPGESRQVSANLADIRMQSTLRIRQARIQTPGSVSPVTIEAGSGLEFTVSLSGTSVRAAKARIPRQTVFSVRDSIFVVDDSVSIQSAVFKGGLVDAVFENDIDVKVTVFLKFNEIRDRSTGQSLTIRHEFDGRGTLTIPIHAREYQIQSAKDTIGTFLTFSVGIETIESQTFREIRSTDRVRAELRPGDPFVMQSVTGRIKPMSVSVNAGGSGVELGEASKKFKGNFTFDSVKIALNVRMTGGFPVDYDLRFIAMNRNVFPPKIDSLVVPPPVGSTRKRFFPGGSQTTQIVLDNSSGLNTFLSKFFPNLPDTFIVRGTVLMNPPDVYPTPQGKQTIWDTTKIYTDVDFSFPLKIGIEAGELTDTVDIGTGEKFPRDFANSVKRGTMYFEITNGLPVQLRFSAALLGTTTGTSRDTLLRIPADGPRTILSGSVDQQGIVRKPELSSFSISMSREEMETFNSSDVLWFRFELETSGGGRIPVKIRNTDYVRIRASASMVYTVNRQ